MPGIDSFTTLMKRLSLGDLLVRRNPVHYGRARHWLAQLQAAPLHERQMLIQRRLLRTLKRAAQTPYGRSVGGTIDLASWPLLDKTQLREDSTRLHTVTARFAVGASTSGTTGVQVHIRRSFESMAVEQYYIDEVIHRLGIDPRTARTAILRGESVKAADDLAPPYWIYSGNGRRMHMSCAHLNPETIAAYAQALREFQPHVLWVYPSNLEWLCNLLRQAGIDFRTPHVLSSSEVLSQEARRMARDVLGATVADYYGQAERVAFGYAMEHGKFFFSPGYAHVELLPVDGDETSTLREIVGTTLWNAAMPLVRYRSGDLVAVPADSTPAQIEEICLGLRSVTGVIGRTVEFLVSPEGTIVNSVGNLTKNANHVIRVQLVQTELDSVTLRLLVEEGFSDDDLREIEHNGRDNIPPSMKLNIEVVPELTRTPLGKTPLVVLGPKIKRYLSDRNLVGGTR